MKLNDKVIFTDTNEIGIIVSENSYQNGVAWKVKLEGGDFRSIDKDNNILKPFPVLK